MNKTRLSIPKMDCGAEEQLVRMTLGGRPEIFRVEANLAARELTVVHQGEAESLAALLAPLNLGARIVQTTKAASDEAGIPDKTEEVRTLKFVLAINAAMFVGELIGAYVADSSALLADSLDMFADATVYGIALFGAHRSRVLQLKAARLTGVLQLVLSLGAFAEVARRLVFGSEPEAPLMVGVSIVALAANATSLWLLAKHRGGGAHMKATWICTQTDVIANVGVIAAAILVYMLQSALPDLVMGSLIALIVLSGAVRILRLKA